MNNFAHSKSELRKLIRDKRRSLSPTQQTAAAHGLLTQLQSLSVFSNAQTIAMYLVNDGEINPVEVMHWCWENKKQTYVPIIDGDDNRELVFAEVSQQTRFVKNKFNIDEPKVSRSELRRADGLDLVLMPLVAFDHSGNRIGMGGGYYDTTFEFVKISKVAKPELVGIAHEIQKLDEIHAESWDIPLTTVVTDKKVYAL